MGWKLDKWGGCECHGQTFCPDYEFVGYAEDDTPMFVRKDRYEELRRASALMLSPSYQDGEGI